MNIVTIIQARMGSSRLPGKVLLPLNDRTVLSHVVQRCKLIPLSNMLVVATTTSPLDDIIEDECNKLDVICHRGSEDDVLSRYYDAATRFKADVIVRITSDCPLLDPEVSNQIIKQYLESGCDYCSNALIRSFPRGLDTEVFSFTSLENAFQNAKNKSQREHVTPYINQQPGLFKIVDYVGKDDLSKYRWTLDTIEDYQLLYKLFKYLGDSNSDNHLSYMFGIEAMEKNPEWITINAHVEQKKI